MSNVQDLLTMSHPKGTKVQTTRPDATLWDAIKVMREKNIGCLPVLDEGVMVGIISERDMAFNAFFNGADAKTTKVKKYMTRYPKYVNNKTDILECLDQMKELNVRHMPVLNKGKLVGVVSMRDVMNALLKDKELLAEQLENYIHGNR